MLMIRFAAVFVYIIASLLALKTFSDLATGKAALEGMWGISVLILIASIGAGIAAWMLDRRYCKITPPQKPDGQNLAKKNGDE